MSLGEVCNYRFGEFELEPEERRLLRGGAPVALTPKAFELLVLLVERAGRVVGKDELMSALWPRTFVIESNLTKHIWVLRRALGDAEGGERHIETVSKLGYRFVAPVERSIGPANGPIISAPEVGPASLTGGRRPFWPVGWAVLALVVFVVIGAAAWVAVTRLGGSFPLGSSPRSGAAAAVVGLNNLSRDPADAWIGPALVEMLGTDIASSGRVRTLPDELARAAAAGLGPPGAGGYGPANLALLRRRLGADYVISGSYLVSGDSVGEHAVRLDFAVQDARSGSTLATLSRSGLVGQLPALATLAGADLRRGLGLSSVGGPDAALAANASPPTADVMRHVGFGLKALHDFDPARARDELIEAVVEAPAYAPAYAYLARAWSALGYQAKALAAAQQAAAHSSGLPPTLRLQIAAQRSLTQFDWPGAIASLRALIGLHPADPEYRLQLIDALMQGGKLTDAEAALGALRGLGSDVREDPRIELAAGRIAGARDDPSAQIAHAARALEQARLSDSAGLAAEAETQLGIARGDADFLQRALANYRRVGNPHGEARARMNLGNALAAHDPPGARVEYERALAQYQAIGDQAGVAAVYSNLGDMLWESGDRDGAQAAVRHVLEIRREAGDAVGQAWALTALAIEQSDEAASDDVIDNFHKAIALDESVEARGHLAFTLYSLSDILRLRGALAEAQRTCAVAQRAYAGLADPAARGQADFECALIALDRGQVAGARASLERARASAGRSNVMMAANADMTLGQIEMGLRQWPAAAQHIAAAEQTFARAELVTGQANAAALLALCHSALGRAQDRDRAAARARQLRSRVTELQEVIGADIALAQVRGQSGQRDEAIATLRALAEDARRRQWLSWSLEAKLAAVQLIGPGAPGSEARRLRNELAAQARASGFGWILQRLG